MENLLTHSAFYWVIVIFLASQYGYILYRKGEDPYDGEVWQFILKELFLLLLSICVCIVMFSLSDHAIHWPWLITIYAVFVIGSWQSSEGISWFDIDGTQIWSNVGMCFFIFWFVKLIEWGIGKLI